MFKGKNKNQTIGQYLLGTMGAKGYIPLRTWAKKYGHDPKNLNALLYKNQLGPTIRRGRYRFVKDQPLAQEERNVSA